MVTQDTEREIKKAENRFEDGVGFVILGLCILLASVPETAKDFSVSLLERNSWDLLKTGVTLTMAGCGIMGILVGVGMTKEATVQEIVTRVGVLSHRGK
ncbi:MAG: hypothetical protein M1484_05145 [Patescibacteria group bacterium]|nr:hypothetical protein [Patescibacteria group bacterium]MCL5432440.1 hypothetical protein [Patescibacteria group bacterium]